ncbi:iron ABC transporter permease [Clostridium sp. CS001]|uniref:FecCD family ABC transporter permease n=1 Tax=Clostridium sp. CS001 TaxID=2880648 RepID=UPI001CF4A2F2|nr:iron ABC transporter permease [Clostridium sp. CS001]MCB2289952.1 iron ABC transporter permease [Clostridium sp. CS001]
MEKAVKSNKLLEKIVYHKLFLFFIIFLVVFILSIFLGRYKMSIDEYKNIFVNLQKLIQGETISDPSILILYKVRLPRILLASFVGAGLSISGLVFQQVFKNPIASPDILGVTSGASFGAALGIILPLQFPGIVQISAFIFGILSVVIVYGLKRASKDNNILYLVLAGIIVSAFFSALLSMIKYLADPYQQLPSIVFWSMGGLYRANWINVIGAGIVVVPSIFIINSLRFKLKMLSLNDDMAKTMGMEVSKFRNYILCLVSFVVCFCVSIAGTISWIALIVPHITRIILGYKNKYIYLITSLIGATTLILFDDIARTISTTEIPVGILTAAIGAPILGYLLIFKKTV